MKTISKIKEINKKEVHKHIWKYSGKYIRVCEAPFPTIISCGREEWMTSLNGWQKADDIIKARSEL